MTLVWGMLIGFLLGIALCYAKQIKSAYDNKDKISAIAGASEALDNLRSAFKF